MTDFIYWLNGIVWHDAMVVMLLGLSIYFCVRMKFGTIRNFRLQIKLLFSGNGDSAEGISSFQAFCSVAAYRVAVGNVGGVMVAILGGGPGAILWMMIASIISTGIAFAENTLGQVYKIRQDGQYRGGPYYYLERAMNMKWLGIIYAALITVSMCVFVTGASASNIGLAMQNSFGIEPYVTGAVVAVLLLLVISGGIRRIAKFSTVIVPIMSVVYVGLGLVVIIANFSAIPDTVVLIVTSAFSGNSIFYGMLGAAIAMGVKRAIMSSGAGMGESVPAAAAAETDHPAEQGIVNAFSVYIDLAVCFTSGIIVIITDCFNVVSGAINYVGQGSPIMADQTDASVVWVQEGANTVLPEIGGILVAICLTLFAFSTSVAYYYESETSLTYLMRGNTEKARKAVTSVLRVIMAATFFYWFGVSASITWAIGEIAFGLMIWINCVALIFLSKTVITTYKDYMDQRKSGIEKPVFNPEKLGIKNAELWMDINKDKIASSK